LTLDKKLSGREAETDVTMLAKVKVLTRKDLETIILRLLLGEDQ